MTPLDDISAFVNQLRTEHRRTADTEHAWLALKETVEGAATLLRPPGRPSASPASPSASPASPPVNPPLSNC